MKSIPQEDLDRGRDLFGRAIEVGTKVRSHDFAFGLKGRTLPLGMQTEGDRASYVEGVVEAIGDITIEGCPRYTIRPFVRVRAGEAESAEGDECIHPPVNGTPSLMGGVTCGVEVIEVYDEWDHAGGRTWYATLPETELSHFWTPECPSISEESDGFWLRSESTASKRRRTPCSGRSRSIDIPRRSASKPRRILDRAGASISRTGFPSSRGPATARK